MKRKLRKFYSIIHSFNYYNFGLNYMLGIENTKMEQKNPIHALKEFTIYYVEQISQ